MSENETKQLKLKRGQIKGLVTRFCNFLNGGDTQADCSELETRLSKIEPLWEEFDVIQHQLELLDETEVRSGERELFEESFFKLVGLTKKLIKEQERNASSSNSPGSNATNLNPTNSLNNHLNYKLPPIQLPVFDGAIDEWLAYYDTFDSLIHKNDEISDIQKFHYLRSSLKNEAAEVIRALEVSAANYQVAWTLLKERFQNKRLMIHNHVKALFELSPLTKESATGLRQLLDNVSKHLRALKSLSQPIESWDTLVIYLITLKLDLATKREWETSIVSTESPTLADITKFLTNRCQVLETLNLDKQNPKSHQTHPVNNSKFHNHKHNERSTAVHFTVQTPVCEFCKASHTIYKCDTFRKLPLNSRISEMKKLKLCENCLRQGHNAQNCKARPCMICKAKHNTLIHVESTTTTQISNEPLTSITTHCAYKNNTQVLLSTAIIYVYGKSGAAHECRVLLDSGSQSNFVTEEMVHLLQLDRTKINLPVSSINKTVTTINFKTAARIKSRYNDFEVTLAFLILPRITDNLPAVHFDSTLLHIPSNRKLADPTFNKPGKIDMLLGAEIFWQLLLVGHIKLDKNQPLLVNTRFGWIISGAMNQHIESSTSSSCNLSVSQSLDEKLTRFWQLEDCGEAPKFTEEELECEKHFVANTIRDNSERFVVALPRREKSVNLGDSKQIALKRLYAIERKFQRQPNLKDEYLQFMQEYESMGHMTYTHDNESNSPPNTYYLPHHAVVKPSSTTTRVRVVFDGSAKSSNGLSLNDMLMVGPTIQHELFSIILRFRAHEYVFTADIAKMYRQIRIRSEDRHMQRILWRENTDQPVKCYTLNTVTYGTASAPFLAVRCLHQLAKENNNEYPIASNVILNDFYVDDLITGANTLREAQAIKKQVTTILKTAGFELRKFTSNDIRILEDNLDQASEDAAFQITDNQGVKTLGLLWDTKTDTFQYAVNSRDNHRITKRKILSAVAQIFDPLGLLGPITVTAKLIIQKLWQLKINWDESLPVDIYTLWLQFEEQIPAIQHIRISRHVVCKDPSSRQLHGFCDASEAAYGACIYMRSTDATGNHHIQLLCSKSRVAPLKAISLPRLELCGALLLAKLVRKAVESLNCNIEETFYWCDSSIVLAWISAPSRQWKTFVANRVAEIQELTVSSSWHHVGSQDNPADVISRGTSPNQLINKDIWWNGPHWLSHDRNSWPQSTMLNIPNIVPEQRTTVNTFLNLLDANFNLFEKYSKLTRLQRIVAYVIRFARNASKAQNVRHFGNLSLEELSESLNCLLKLAQGREFENDLQSLKTKGTVGSKSKLITLNPFLDEKGLIRVGGRLRNAHINYNQRHPVVLPPRHPLTKMIIWQEHIQLLHAGPQAVIASIRTNFWPLATRNTVKGVLRTCVKCFRCNPRNTQQLMGDLPEARLLAARPFLKCGVDYAGPFYVKEGKTRGRKIVKAYLCLFICFATRAVHLELVSELTTDCFLNALKRFISRRGKCLEIFSDNATNFSGANNELKELGHFLMNQGQSDKINTFLNQEMIKWHFIPPRAPHFGGLWEAAIKSAKYHLKRIVGDAALTFEELYTVLTQIEACLNSRPLTAISDDPNDLSPLTPGHFIIGDSLKAVPQDDVQGIPSTRLSRYQRLQQLLQHFWSRWSKEYLGQLQQRTKWQRSFQDQVKLGSLVVIREDNLPPLKWQMGRIVKLYTGKDNVCRVVDVKTSSGVVKRAISKVCVLPIDY